jgi:tetratricopeptide (TPR) repeat protein
MCEGEKAKVIVPSELGFGMMENPHGFHASNKNIPSDSTLFFEIEMMEVGLPPKKETNSNELIEEARDLKDFGNNLFKKEDLERAIRKYNMALEKIKEIKKDTITTEQQNDMNLISLNCFNNLGVVTYKYGDYHMTIDYCTKALEIDPKNYKALYRLALAQKQKTEYSDAKKNIIKSCGNKKY